MAPELPLVSIITPSLNQGRFIKETILSIKNQTHPRIEHIIMDGGSTDDTLDIIKRYDGTYNMQWTSEPDNGMYEAINKGLRKAQGNILAYLNADDLYFPWTVSVVADYLVRYPDSDFVYGDLMFLDLETGKTGIKLYPRYARQSLMMGRNLGQPAVFFRRSMLERVGFFDESLKLVADREYWMRAMSKQCRFSKIDEVLAIFRQHGTTQSTVKHPLLVQEGQQVLEKYRTTKQSNGSLFKIIDYLRSAWRWRWAMIKFTCGYYRIRGKSPPAGHKLSCQWQNLVGFPGFQLILLPALLRTISPWLSKVYPKNWVQVDVKQLLRE